MPHLSTAERIGRREGRKEGRIEGREEGREEGRLEEARASIIDILEVRLGTVSSDMASRLTQITEIDRLHSLRKLLVGGTPLDAFEQALNGGDRTDAS